jgi:hypothetical protein
VVFGRRSFCSRCGCRIRVRPRIRRLRHKVRKRSWTVANTLSTSWVGIPFGQIRYDNSKSAVSRVVFGRNRAESDRWVLFRSHIDPFYCIPGKEGAHEKGGVEGEGGRFRHTHLVPVPRVDSLSELNALLLAATSETVTVIGFADIAEYANISQRLTSSRLEIYRSLPPATGGVANPAQHEAVLRVLAGIRFVNLIVNELTANGIMEPTRLFESPYTDYAPIGPEFFPPADVEVIVDILGEVKEHARPSDVA